MHVSFTIFNPFFYRLRSFALTSLQDWIAMYSANIFLAFEAILDCDLIFLYSSHASQNSRFSSLNSVRRKALNAARPSEGKAEGWEGKEENKQGESWLKCHGNLKAEALLRVSVSKNNSVTAFWVMWLE